VNRKNSFSINRRGQTVDRYGRVFELDTREMKKRRRPLKGDKYQTRGPDVYPAPNAMKPTGGIS
jgi:hypothetical protein